MGQVMVKQLFEAVLFDMFIQTGTQSLEMWALARFLSCESLMLPFPEGK
jgi:hypothetical protein